MKQNKETIKSYFETGDKPTQQEYHDTWDSFRHKDEQVPAELLEGQIKTEDNGINVNPTTYNDLSKGITFGDGDTGVFEISDDKLILQTGSTSSGLQIQGGSGNVVQSNNSNGFRTKQVQSQTDPTYSSRADEDTGVGFSGEDTAHLIAGGTNTLTWKSDGQITAPATTNAVIDTESSGKVLVTKEWIDAQGFVDGTTLNLQQITDVNNSTSNDIELVGGNLSITDGDAPSNPFDGNLNISYTDENTGNVFSIYNAVTKIKSAANQFLYGINNLIYHNAPEDIGYVYGAFNRARTLNSGTPTDMIGTFNEASYRNTGSGTINLLSGSENYVKVDDFGGTGTIANTIGVRGKVIQNNANVTSSNVNSGVFGLDLEDGVVNSWTGVLIDLNQSGGTVNSGAYLKLDIGTQLPNVNMKAIESIVDLPSYFKGSIESDVTIAQIDTASDKVLTTKEWVQANTASKFSSTLGDGTSTTINVSHNLGSEDVIIQLRDVSSKTVSESIMTIVDANTISLTFDTAPALDEYRVVVMA
ncbi:hypothetical protein [uncultured Psychroserpens sp.]|uniref:hypothetical protein n=1 Tax=uncultured Psychroserpens sp. TaxID=255436 RepID=UPI002625E96E|nr:hypothetical protein [uncultured Psychroserpens sp.]